MAAALDTVTTDFALLVNDDAVADRHFVREILHEFDADGGDRVAAVTGLVVLDRPLAPAQWPRGRAEPGVWLDNAGWPFVSGDDPRAAGPAVVRANSTGNEVRADGNAQDRDWLRALDDGRSPAASLPDVFGFCGAAAGLRTAAVREAGGMDASLFLYWEDTDLSWRLRRLGWRVRYRPTAVVHHEHAASSGTGSTVFRFHNERNRLIVLTRHAPGRLVAVALGRYLARTALMVGRGPHRLLPGRARVLASFARRLPRVLRERGRLERAATVPRADVAGLVVPVPE